MTAQETQTNSEITIRRMDLTGADQRALARLAALDSHAPLEGTVLGAEVGGHLRAAISLDGGELVADPFSRTSELGTLLELRAGQLQKRQPWRSRWTRRNRVGTHREPRLALGGSPPGEIVSLMRDR